MNDFKSNITSTKLWIVTNQSPHIDILQMLSLFPPYHLAFLGFY